MTTPGYTRLTATGLGDGARDVWTSTVIDTQDRDSRRSGRVIQTFDRTAYIAFDTETRSYPYVLTLGTAAVRHGPLLIATDAGPRFSFSDLVTSNEDCHVRQTAGHDNGHVLAVGSVLDIEIGPDILESASTRPRCIHSIRTIEHGGPVWNQGRDVLQSIQKAGIADGLGWLERMRKPTDTSTDAPGLHFQQTTDMWIKLLEQDRLDTADISAVTDLVGLGPGATPSGDDILSGILFTLMHTTEKTDRQIVHTAADKLIRKSKSTTTLMSLALLEQAAQGRAPAVVEDFLTTILNAEPPERCQEAAIAMADMGHHSGADALAGILATLLVIAPATSSSHCRTAR